MSGDPPGNGRRRAGHRRAGRERPYRDDGYPGSGGPEYGPSYPGDSYQGQPGPGYPERDYPGDGYQDPGYQDPGYQDPGYQDPGYQDPGYQDPGYRYAGQPDQAYAGTGYPPRPGDTAYLYQEDFSVRDEDDIDDGDPGPGSPGPRSRSARRAPRSPSGRSGLNRRAFIGVAAGLGVAGAGAIVLSQLGGNGPRYKFADDFNGPAGSAPDPAKWAYDLGGGGWGNNELEIYTSSRQNSFQDGNGNLVIRATRTVDNGQATYYSARLKTLGKFSQYHGTFEARIKIDPQDGTWPAWWMMGTDITKVGWPQCGEVDILENFGGAPDVATSVHTPDGGAGTYTRRASTPVDGAWHVWRMHWTAAGFTFFKDGVQYQRVTPGDMPDWVFSSGVPMFMLLNLAVGGAAGTPPADAPFPIDMLVDYVHVW